MQADAGVGEGKAEGKRKKKGYPMCIRLQGFFLSFLFYHEQAILLSAKERDEKERERETREKVLARERKNQRRLSFLLFSFS